MTSNARTGLEKLPVDTCWELVAQQTVGRLAVAVDGQPDVFPVNYVVEDRTIVIHTMPGLKLASAIFGRGVAFEVDTLDADRRAGWSVVIQGKAEEITGTEPLLDAEALGIRPWAESPKYRYLRIQPTQVVGRRIPDSGAQV